MARGGKDRHEPGPTYLLVGEVYRRAKIAQLEVLQEFVVAREASGRAGQLAGVIPVEQFAHCPPLRRPRDYGVADFEQGRRLRMPETTSGETATSFKVKVKPGRVDVLAAVRKAHGEVRLIRAFVGREARVAVDAKQRAARRPGIGHKIGRDFI